MERDPAFDDRTAEDVLHGRTAALDEDQRELAELMAAIRRRAVVAPRPNADLLEVFRAGIVPDPGMPVGATPGDPRSRIRRRIAKVAGFSVTAKLALAGAAAAAAVVGGSGAAGVLPGQGSEPGDAGTVDLRDVADDAVPDELDVGDAPGGVRGAETDRFADRDDPGVERGPLRSEPGRTDDDPARGTAEGRIPLPEIDPPTEDGPSGGTLPVPEPVPPLPDDLPVPDIAPVPDVVPDPREALDRTEKPANGPSVGPPPAPTVSDTTDPNIDGTPVDEVPGSRHIP